MPIIESGTFNINGMELTAIQTSDGFVNWTPGGSPLPILPGSWNTVGLSGNNHSGGWTLSFVAGHSVVTRPGHSAFFIENPPPGFKPTTGLLAIPNTTYNFTTPAGGESVSANFQGLGSASFTTVASPSGAVGALPAIVIPDNTSFFLLRTSILQIDAHVVGQPFTAGSGVDTSGNSSWITGSYVIEMFWWTIAATDECGNKHTSRLKLSADQPANSPEGDEYVRLDPADPDAAPTPLIHGIEPNHGDLVGGTLVTIYGEGFGEDATVTFGGVAATGVTVVDQFKITCNAPAHARGPVTVVVTNADGVHT